MFAVGAASLHAQGDQQTPWSFGATVRGFYDDNPLVQTDAVLNGLEDDGSSFGIQGGPNIGYHVSTGATDFSISYEYIYRYFEADFMEDDQVHRVDLSLSHDVDDTLRLYASDQFVRTREPSILEPSGAVTTLLRSEQDVSRNFGTVGAVKQFTETFSAGLEYNNRFYNYQEQAFARILDRIEHTVTLDGRWTLREEQGQPITTGILGYQFQSVGYTEDAVISPGVSSDIRDRRSHFGFVGVDHAFSPRFQASVRVGAQFTQYPNTPADADTTNPYADAKLAYQVAEDSSLSIGVRHQRNSTDVSAFDVLTSANDVTLDQESTTVYGQYTHGFTDRLTARVTGQAQMSSFEGGIYDDTDETLILVGASLSYEISQYLETELGYRYQDLSNDGPLAAVREFDRNYVYLGLTASY